MDMSKQIKAFNKQSGHGRPGGLTGALLGGIMGAMSGDPLSGAIAGLMGGASIGGQTPQLCASEAFDLNMQMAL
jgi:hypothetical protein